MTMLASVIDIEETLKYSNDIDQVKDILDNVTSGLPSNPIGLIESLRAMVLELIKEQIGQIEHEAVNPTQDDLNEMYGELINGSLAYSDESAKDKLAEMLKGLGATKTELAEVVNYLFENSHMLELDIKTMHPMSTNGPFGCLCYMGEIGERETHLPGELIVTIKEAIELGVLTEKDVSDDLCIHDFDSDYPYILAYSDDHLCVCADPSEVVEMAHDYINDENL